jgi:hypothetical protein
MTASPRIVTVLGAHHDRSRFGCGSQALDRYLREQVTSGVAFIVSSG